MALVAAIKTMVKYVILIFCRVNTAVSARGGRRDE